MWHCDSHFMDIQTAVGDGKGFHVIDLRSDPSCDLPNSNSREICDDDKAFLIFGKCSGRSYSLQKQVQIAEQRARSNFTAKSTNFVELGGRYHFELKEDKTLLCSQPMQSILAFINPICHKYFNSVTNGSDRQV